MLSAVVDCGELVLGGGVVSGGLEDDVVDLDVPPVVVLDVIVCCVLSLASLDIYGNHSAGMFCSDWLLRAHAVARTVKKSDRC